MGEKARVDGGRGAREVPDSSSRTDLLPSAPTATGGSAPSSTRRSSRSRCRPTSRRRRWSRAPRPRSPRRARSCTHVARRAARAAVAEGAGCRRRTRRGDAEEGRSSASRTSSPRTTPSPTSSSPRTRRNLDKLRAFIEKHDLLALPPKETLARRADARVQARLVGGRVPRARACSMTQADLARDLLRRSRSIPRGRPTRSSRTCAGRTTTRSQLVAAHEAYPGHHTQYFYERKNLNPLRAVLWNAADGRGLGGLRRGAAWSALGWGGKRNDRFRFYDLRGQMIVATNIAPRHQAAVAAR